VGLIYLDSCLLIYAIENDPLYGSAVRERLAAVPDATMALSPLVKLECLVGPMRSGNLQLQQHYEAALAHLTVLPMPEPVFLLGAQIRAHFGLKTPDALHLATAQFHNCEALWTHDSRLASAGHGLAINILATAG
jgi:predicted nucleic acid-binding protein